MRSGWWLAPIGMGLILAVVAVGCGSSGDGEGSEGEAGGEEDQALLEQMVLTADDLPSGLQRVSASFTTNEELTQGTPNPAEELAKLEQWGRRLGYDVTFLPTPDSPADLVVRGLQVAVSLYDTAQGGGFSLAANIAQARAADLTSAYPGLEELEVGEVEGRDIGDDTFWLRATGFDPQNPTALLVDDQVAFRVGRVRAFLRVDVEILGAVDRTVYMNEVEARARLLSERIASVLATEAVP